MKLLLLLSIPLIIATSTNRNEIKTEFCATPKTGSFWNKKELVDLSSGIFLVKARFKENKHKRDFFTFEIIETIKGKKPSEIVIASYLDKPIKNHFSLHKENAFWAENTGRSPYPYGICQPLHTFEEGKTYLLFPDAIGAMASAEIIASKNDKWLLFVKDRVANKQTISYN